MSTMLLLVFLFPAGVVDAEPKAKQPDHIGEVIIVGNTITQDRVIRAALDFWPGQLQERKAISGIGRRLRNAKLE
ncbi:MAG: hypothetical protein FJ303_04960 [Planctomycetes bacterium]|nr:hypothetical protein [Planctomycetota bacterium]